MFVHDKETNALRLRDAQDGYPWVSEKHGEWLYCADCYERWLNASDRSRWNFVPFRDKASQGSLKPTWNQLKRRHEETELEARCQDPPVPNSEPNVSPDDVMAEDAPVYDVPPAFVDVGGLGSQTLAETPAGEDDVLLPQMETQDDELEEPKVELLEHMEVERPSLEEYQTKWDNLLEHHSRIVSGPFSAENLCPTPVHQLWHVP